MEHNELDPSVRPATPATPSATSFSEIIDDAALVARLNELDIIVPTPVQAAAIPLAREGGDFIVQAQTGSGKTLAFVLPILAKIRKIPPVRSTLAMIVTPTRELALQVAKVIETVAPDVRPPCIIGGANPRAQERQVEEDPRIVVGTPGRILDFIRSRVILLRKCRMFVLDEADEMLSMGFIDEVREILSKLPTPRQGLFFSATITPRVASLAGSFLKKPSTITIDTTESAPRQIEHLYVNVDGGVTSKADALYRLLAVEKPESAIVFCNTKSDTELVEVILRRRGIESRRINSDLSQKERTKVMESLRSGELKILIATDVAARGIDIKELELVVNYALHNETETYLHRTGRTGRAGASGRAVSLIGPQDMTSFFALRKQLGLPFVELTLPEKVSDGVSVNGTVTNGIATNGTAMNGGASNGSPDSGGPVPPNAPSDLQAA